MAQIMTPDPVSGSRERRRPRAGRIAGGLSGVISVVRLPEATPRTRVSPEPTRTGRTADISKRLDRIETRLELREAE